MAPFLPLYSHATAVPLCCAENSPNRLTFSPIRFCSFALFSHSTYLIPHLLSFRQMGHKLVTARFCRLLYLTEWAKKKPAPCVAGRFPAPVLKRGERYVLPLSLP